MYELHYDTRDRFVWITDSHGDTVASRTAEKGQKLFEAVGALASSLNLARTSNFVRTVRWRSTEFKAHAVSLPVTEDSARIVQVGTL